MLFRSSNHELDNKVSEVIQGDDPVICEVIVPIDLKIFPKQVSYKNNQGQMESLPLEYLNPILEEAEFLENMIIPIYKKE